MLKCRDKKHPRLAPLLLSVMTGAVLLGPGTVWAQEPPPVRADGRTIVLGPSGVPLMASPTPLDEVVMEPIGEPGGRVQVINSDRTILASRFPATFAWAGCTATLIGPRVLVTAAHCVEKYVTVDGKWINNKPLKIRFKANNDAVDVKSCQGIKDYMTASVQPGTVRSSLDFALCDLFENAAPPPETPDLTSAGAASGTRILLAGYGCTEASLRNGIIPLFHSEYGKGLRAGFNRLGGDAIQSWISADGKVGSDRAIVCPGDSGGAVYRGMTVAQASDNNRRIVAVVSAVGPTAAQYQRWNTPGAAANRDVEYKSYFSPLSHPAFVTFLASWQTESSATRMVCGYKGFVGSCRN